MIHVNSPHPKGTVILAQGQFSRFPEFETCLDSLQVPHGTEIYRIQTGVCALGCNMGLRQRVGEWVWFIDDDQLWADPKIILKLLDHGKDMVAPLVPDRRPPFSMVMYKTLGYTGPKTFSAIPYTVDEIKYRSGLMLVEGLPKSGLLARESVWQKMPDPWFKVGRLFPDQIDDDRVFMYEARQAGFELWCDTDQVLWHMNTLAVGLVRDQTGAWSLRGQVAGRTFPL